MQSHTRAQRLGGHMGVEMDMEDHHDDDTAADSTALARMAAIRSDELKDPSRSRARLS